MSGTCLNHVSVINMSDLSWQNLTQSYLREIDCDKRFTRVKKATCNYVEGALINLNFTCIYKKLKYM